MPEFRVPDHLGWHEQGDGRLYLGVPVPSGRIADDEHGRLRAALREIVARFGVNPILMPTQDVILRDIDPADRDAIEAVLRANGVRLAEELLPVERWALACPALPSCGLALTEAERVRDEIVGAIAARLRRWGLEGERLSIRITGCPNGCARPYNGDIGIVGRMPGFYSLYVGGDFAGHPAQPAARRPARHRRNRGRARPAIRAVRRRAAGGRRLRRFLQPDRRCRAARAEPRRSRDASIAS